MGASLEHTQHSNPRGQELLEHIKKEWQIKMMMCFSSSLMKRVLNFMRNPKLAHILVYLYKYAKVDGGGVSREVTLNFVRVPGQHPGHII